MGSTARLWPSDSGGAEFHYKGLFPSGSGFINSLCAGLMSAALRETNGPRVVGNETSDGFEERRGQRAARTCAQRLNITRRESSWKRGEEKRGEEGEKQSSEAERGRFSSVERPKKRSSRVSINPTVTWSCISPHLLGPFLGQSGKRVWHIKIFKGKGLIC